MDADSLLLALIQINHRKQQHVTRAHALILAAADQLNECAMATGNDLVVDIPSEMRCEGGGPVTRVPFTRLFCPDLTNEELIDAGVATVLEALPHFPFWLDSVDGLSAVINLARVVDIYGDLLLQDRTQRKVWRTVSVTIANGRERGAWSGADDRVMEYLHNFITTYLNFAATGP